MQENPQIFLQTCAAEVTNSSRYHILADLTPRTGRVLNESQLLRLSTLVQELGLSPKALFLLRDPLQRSVSELSMLVRNGLRENFEVLNRPGTPEYLRETDHLVETNLARLINTFSDDPVR